MAVPKFPELEEQILQDWKDQNVFKQTLEQNAKGERFVFYEGPPTANGMPHMGHVETRAFKDVILRYKTMRGYYVERKAGWDTQGLPVELEVEKALGISGKKDIEKYGIAEFNAQAKESVWKYKDLWEKMTERVGFWLDTSDPYITYHNEYIESLWWILKQAWDQKLLVQDYKVVPYCPRCGTALSSHEVAQGYESVTEPAVFVKFPLEDEPDTYILAWTTTPWTLPGNVALAVGEKIEYAKVEAQNGEFYWIAKDRMDNLDEADRHVLETKPGSELVGKQYQQLFDFLDLRKESGKKAYYIAAADFVSTEDGTGVVHTAVMYGEDDFVLGTELDLPKMHTVDEAGKFTELVKPWAGQEVRDDQGKTQQGIIEYLQDHGLLYKVEDYTHDYPFCWRCKHPLLYYAKTSWFIQMSKLQKQLLKNNDKINWYPNHLKEGRFGEWLREVKDWAISRERYWGTPLPIWECDQCKHQDCLGSYQELIERMPTRNTYIFVRHGQSENNADNTLDTVLSDGSSDLTELGRKQSAQAAKALAKTKVDAIYSSQFPRAKQTADIISQTVGTEVIEDKRINEYHIGPEYEGRNVKEFHVKWGDRMKRLHHAPLGGETWMEIRSRMFDFLHELDAKHEGKTFVIVTHADPIYVLRWALTLGPATMIPEIDYPENARPYEVRFPAKLYHRDGGFDPHRPFIDEAKYPCTKCDGTMQRVLEVADTWFDSGSMPLAQWHYPFENEHRVKKTSYPADYITEAIDQTRGWFYTLLAVATVLEKAKVVKQPPYKNVLVFGHVRDAKGKKLSKSLGNYIDPMELIAEHGADPIRFYLFTMNQPGEPKNFDLKGLDEVVKKTFLILMNIVSFSQLYQPAAGAKVENASHPMDRWLESRLNQLIADVTRRLDQFDITGGGRAIAAFITELSTWYVRRNRSRMKGDDRAIPAATLHQALLTVSRLLAPFTPFLAEHVYKTVGGTKSSVHLEAWPEAGQVDQRMLDEMQELRSIIEQGHSVRAQHGIKVRQPLSQAVVKKTLRQGFDEILKEELNVKELIDNAPLSKGTVSDDHQTAEVEHPMIAIDVTITDELKGEGMLRDLVREFNALRKAAKLEPSDEIIALVEPNTIAAQVIERFSQEFLKQVRATAATPSIAGATETAVIQLDKIEQTIGLKPV